MVWLYMSHRNFCVLYHLRGGVAKWAYTHCKDISLKQVHKLATQVYLCLEHAFYMRGIIPTG